MNKTEIYNQIIKRELFLQVTITNWIQNRNTNNKVKNEQKKKNTNSILEDNKYLNYREHGAKPPTKP